MTTDIVPLTPLLLSHHTPRNSTDGRSDNLHRTLRSFPIILTFQSLSNINSYYTRQEETASIMTNFNMSLILNNMSH